MKNKLFYMLMMLSLLFAQSGLAQGGVSPAPSGQSPGLKPDSQKKISLDIKGMDIVDVLKMLATESGINIVIGKNVTGRVTLLLKNVNVSDAFDIIVLANDLAYERKGDIVNVMTQKDYEALYGSRFQDKKLAKIINLKYAKAGNLANPLNQIKSNIGKIVSDEISNTLVLIDTPEKIREMEDFIKSIDLPVQTRVLALNYASAEKLGVKLQEVITKGVGSIKIDERTNKIAVTDYPKKLEEIAGVISAFDEKPAQVLIDAQIIEITPSDKFEMGVDWNYWIEKNLKVTAALPIGTGSRLLVGTPAVNPAEPGQYKGVLDLLRTIGDTQILSSPRIMALNNQEAKILVGTKDAYITSTTSQAGSGTTVTSQSVNFVDVGIKLYVTPTINRDGFVTMRIRPEISSATRTDITSEGQITQIPIVTTSEAETSVLIKDGVTILIGGLRKDKISKTVKKIPVLGDIPLIGFFLRSTSSEVTKTELVILLTPHIMSATDSFTDFGEMKPKDGAVAKMEKGRIVVERIGSAGDSGSSAAENDTTGYYGLILDKVRALALFTYQGNEKGVVELAFVLSRDGNLVKEPRVLKSDNPALAPFAVKAIKEACPFPPFPRFLERGEEEFKINLSYQ